MSAVSDRSANVKRQPAREVIVGFSPEAVRAPFLLRCGAISIDYIILVAIPVIGLLLSRLAGNDGAKLLNDGLNNAGWLIAVLVGISNLVLLPMFSGQTLGKIVTGLRVVDLDGSTPALSTMALRQTFGYFFTAATLGVGFIAACFNRNGRALHDFVAGTVVIYADRRVRREES
jgi:uncharacterized RDD family membrane protein YckC